jgi:hypothetical protein
MTEFSSVDFTSGRQEKSTWTKISKKALVIICQRTMGLANFCYKSSWELLYSLYRYWSSFIPWIDAIS